MSTMSRSLPTSPPITVSFSNVGELDIAFVERNSPRLGKVCVRLIRPPRPPIPKVVPAKIMSLFMGPVIVGEALLAFSIR
jgi:hypothetical protein